MHRKVQTDCDREAVFMIGRFWEMAAL